MAISCLGGNTTSILAPSRPVVVVYGHLVTRKEVVVYANTVHSLQSVIIQIDCAVSPTALDGFPFFPLPCLEGPSAGADGKGRAIVDSMDASFWSRAPSAIELLTQDRNTESLSRCLALLALPCPALPCLALPCLALPYTGPVPVDSCGTLTPGSTDRGIEAVRGPNQTSADTDQLFLAAVGCKMQSTIWSAPIRGRNRHLPGVRTILASRTQLASVNPSSQPECFGSFSLILPAACPQLKDA
ncbi:hypothetical protein HDV62DRAFT_367565 [Trichoderma sp. SZMC 28011]